MESQIFEFALADRIYMIQQRQRPVGKKADLLCLASIVLSHLMIQARSLIAHVLKNSIIL